MKKQQNTNKQQTKTTLFQKISKTIAKISVYFLISTTVWVIAYRFINPPITWLMIMRSMQKNEDGSTTKMRKKWVAFDKISNNMKRAAVAAEDQLFLNHIGFDVKSIEKAFKNNEKGKKIKGGSTISQQTAKNVFLWHGRSYIRKAFEAYFTLLIEIFWSKERILEVYLNVIEMGDGIYGAEAAAKYYFQKPCSRLTKSQAALIAACFPNPIRWTPKHPTKYIRHRQYLILRNMRRIGPLDF
ncbi:MAG: monofunctional biosynthetic peptidoglycan transglycosylase [Sphingobacteriaceae bacterium]|nr:monofunctional biosynthetic peptidoglycan transglycosylase [Sphingobacteriaceae bacterium]